MDLAAGFLPAVASTGSLVRNESAQSLIRSSSTQLLTIVPQPVKGVGQGFFFGIFSGLGAAVSGTALSVARRVYPEFLDPISANIINEDPEFVCNVHVAIQLFGAGGEGADEFIPVTLAEIKGVFESVAQKVGRAVSARGFNMGSLCAGKGKRSTCCGRDWVGMLLNNSSIQTSLQHIANVQNNSSPTM